MFSDLFWRTNIPKMIHAQIYWSFPGDSVVKNPPTSAGDVGLIPGSGRSPGDGNATYPSIFAWDIPWTEEPDRLQSLVKKESDMT